MKPQTAPYSPPARFQRLFDRFLVRLGKQAVLEGAVKLGGKPDQDLRVDICKYADAVLSGKTRVVFDHRSDLLRDARSFAKKGRHENACLFLATWTEHWVNNIILLALYQNAIDISLLRDVVKDTNMRAKLGWLFRLLGLKALPRVHQTRILRLLDQRNEFVHYKWVGRSESDLDSTAATIAQFLQCYFKTVQYLKGYEEKYLFMGSSTELRRILKAKYHPLPT
jgi:hypothetical protein